MKKLAAALVLIALGAGLYFLFKSQPAAPEPPAGTLTTTNSEIHPSAPATPNQPESGPASVTAGAAALPTNAPAASPAASPPAAPDVSRLPPLTILDNARAAMKNYGATFGENPVGTNPEITEALTGKNPKAINFITAESGLRVNERGEMVDAWGTPFFFHQLSGKEMEIRCAGEDRKMWTFDDLVTR